MSNWLQILWSVVHWLTDGVQKNPRVSSHVCTGTVAQFELPKSTQDESCSHVSQIRPGVWRAEQELEIFLDTL